MFLPTKIKPIGGSKISREDDSVLFPEPIFYLPLNDGKYYSYGRFGWTGTDTEHGFDGPNNTGFWKVETNKGVGVQVGVENDKLRPNYQWNDNYGYHFHPRRNPSSEALKGLYTLNVKKWNDNGRGKLFDWGKKWTFLFFVKTNGEQSDVNYPPLFVLFDSNVNGPNDFEINFQKPENRIVPIFHNFNQTIEYTSYGEDIVPSNEEWKLLSFEWKPIQGNEGQFHVYCDGEIKAISNSYQPNINYSNVIITLGGKHSGRMISNLMWDEFAIFDYNLSELSNYTEVINYIKSHPIMEYNRELPSCVIKIDFDNFDGVSSFSALNPISNYDITYTYNLSGATQSESLKCENIISDSSHRFFEDEGFCLTSTENNEGIYEIYNINSIKNKTSWSVVFYLKVLDNYNGTMIQFGNDVLKTYLLLKCENDFLILYVYENGEMINTYSLTNIIKNEWNQICIKTNEKGKVEVLLNLEPLCEIDIPFSFYQNSASMRFLGDKMNNNISYSFNYRICDIGIYDISIKKKDLYYFNNKNKLI